MSASESLTHALLVDLISERASVWRKRGASTDRVNRYLGRCEVILCRIAARRGELLPTLYVSKRADGLWLTSWPGTKVAKLEERGKARAFRTELTCYRCTIEGRVYIGRGLGESMYINMRPSSRGDHYFVLIRGKVYPVNTKRQKARAARELSRVCHTATRIWCNGVATTDLLYAT